MKNGKISSSSKYPVKLMIVTQLVWLTTIVALVTWWGFLLFQQAFYIESIAAEYGVTLSRDQFPWIATGKMLVWESVAFIFLLVTSTALVIWLYWRDFLRTKSLRSFFASITHEVKTPLASIRLQAESLHDKSAESKLTKRLMEDTSRLETQVERMLELARLEEGGNVLSQEVSLKPFVDNLIENDLRVYSDTLEIVTNLGSSRIVGDAAALRAIFRNLIENSAKHASHPKKKVTIHSTREGNFLKVIVTDNGHSKNTLIEASKLGKLFSKGLESKGAGVGLYLVQTLMKKMGGKAKFALPTQQRGFQAELWFHESENTHR